MHIMGLLILSWLSTAMPLLDQTPTSPLLNTTTLGTNSSTLAIIDSRSAMAPKTLGLAQNHTVKLDHPPAMAEAAADMLQSKENKEMLGKDSGRGTSVDHSTRADPIGPSYFFTGKMFIKCFPKRYILDGTLSPNFAAAASRGIPASSFWQFDASKPHIVYNRQKECRKCDCSVDGLIVKAPSTTQPMDGKYYPCKTDKIALLCTFQMGCYCYHELGAPKPAEGVSLSDHVTAIRKLGLAEKFGNPGWFWSPNSKEGRVFWPSRPHPNDPYRTFQLAPDTKEPYRLEGPDPDYPDDSTDLGSGVGDGFSKFVDFKYGQDFGSSSGVWKRDIESKSSDRMSDEKRTV
ncbi:hypothetical protein TWF225_010241 [Orbilia oligospora]|nr:hypothetical protein TWF225_010241 [Orbilia oligospora]KAF3249708.1 hypothetical protein TWF128_007720 [Orbilia oligospora]KAF3261516.1 hypothetical protein TWF217_004643 [Orbilia oligospora]